MLCISIQPRIRLVCLTWVFPDKFSANTFLFDLLLLETGIEQNPNRMKERNRNQKKERKKNAPKEELYAYTDKLRWYAIYLQTKYENEIQNS